MSGEGELGEDNGVREETRGVRPGTVVAGFVTGRVPAN